MRIGYGFDSHAFSPGVPLKIGGVAIDHPEGLAGHSDGDVLLHAITDALLGAVAVGDIGTFFPPNDPRWKGADSSMFLNVALEEIETAGYRIANVDTTLVLLQPKISPIAETIRERVADLLKISPGCVGIKAKTPEGLNQDGVAVAHAVVLLEPLEQPERLEVMAAEAHDEDDLDEVLKHIALDLHGEGMSRSRGSIARKPVIDTKDLT